MDAEDEQEEFDWAENELGLVGLGDKRLTSRLVTLRRQGKYQVAGKRRGAGSRARSSPANDLCQCRRPGSGRV